MTYTSSTSFRDLDPCICRHLVGSLPEVVIAGGVYPTYLSGLSILLGHVLTKVSDPYSTGQVCH